MKVIQAQIARADALVGAERLKRDAALKRLTSAQNRGAGPNERLKLSQAYDAAEGRLERANALASEARRRLAGPTQLTAEELIIVERSTDPMLGPGAAARLRAMGHGR